MEDKEIYKHLANVYLSKTPNKGKSKSLKLNPIFILLSVNTLIIGILLFVIVIDRVNQPNPFQITSYSLNVNDNDHPLKIKYRLCSPLWPKNQIELHFDDIDLSDFKQMRLFVKGGQEFTKRVILFLHNKNGSKSVSFLNNITEDWKVFIVPFKSLEGERKLSVVNKISFGVENWQINNKKGSIYIGDITFLR